MRKIFPITLSLFLFHCATEEAAKAPSVTAITAPEQIVSATRPEAQKFSIEKFMVTREIFDAVWSPDGSRIVFNSNMSGRLNLWLVSGDGGWPTQLTISEQQQIYPAWSPDGKWIAYMSDDEGNELWDLFLVSPLNGEVLNLTNTPEISEEHPAWSPDGKRLAYLTKAKEASSYEIDLMNIADHQVRHLTINTAAAFSNSYPLWSRDGKWITYTRFDAAGSDANIFIVEVGAEKTILLTEHAGENTFQAASWSPDDSKLLVTSNAGNGYDNVGVLDIASRKIEWLTQNTWETTAGSFSPDGKTLTWVANIDGYREIFLYEVAAKRAQALPLPNGTNHLGGTASVFTRDGSKLLFLHSGPETPRDVWVYSLATASSHPVTQSLVGGLRGEDLVTPFLIHYPSIDGKWQISAFVYMPYNLARNGKNPAVLWVHGGPATQAGNGFNPIVQYLANQGYVVVVPNYRGSTGYGKKFMEANRFDVGGGDYQDVLAAAEWIKKTGYVDPAKIAIMGGSYGGYMTALGLTKSPETWAAGVAIIPVINWFTQFENSDPAVQQFQLSLLGDPIKNKALYEERSPIFFADRIKAPLLLLAGGNDRICPRSEAEQMANVVKKNGGLVELKVYEGEGHGFSRLENEIDALQRIAKFLKRHVPPI